MDMSGTNEAFSRVRIDAQLRDQGWDVLNANAVRLQRMGFREESVSECR